MGKNALDCTKKRPCPLAMSYPSPRCRLFGLTPPLKTVRCWLLIQVCLYLDFLAVFVCLVFDDGGDTVGVGEGLGLILAVDLVGPVSSSWSRHGCVCSKVNKGEV